MEIKREDVLEALSNVIEPDLKKDIVALNFIKALHIEGRKVSTTIKIMNPALHSRSRMKEAVEFTLKRVLGKDIQVETTIKTLPKEEQAIVPRKVLPDVKKIIAIASGKGGVGKSTVTANLAISLAKAGYKVGVVDADIYGPSMPTMFDVVDERPTMIDIEGKPMICPVQSFGIQLLSIGFFTDKDNAIVWRGPMASKALKQMFTESYWGELDFLLVDLPPGTGDIHLSLVQEVPLDGVIIVSTPQEVALADARKGINMFRLENINIPILGIIENMAWFTPAELPENKYYIFGKNGAKALAESANIPFLGHLPLVQSIREAGDNGRPAAFDQNSPCHSVFDELIRNFVKQIER
jgi:ATP-binding protein involved in chromosome partitioning